MALPRDLLFVQPNQESIVLLARGRIGGILGEAGADGAYEAAYRRYPRDKTVLIRYLQYLCRVGRYTEAQQTYRSAACRPAINLPRSQCRWDGQDLEGRTLFLRTDAGFGDLYSVEPARAAVPPPRCARPPWDDATMAAQTPYVVIPPAVSAPWRARVAALGGGLRLGIDWRSGHEHPSKDDPYTCRSIPLEVIRPLFDIPGTTSYSVYVGRPGSAELQRTRPPVRLARLSHEFRDFLDTARALMAVDLVVTVDTSVAHLAGALGRPCLLLLAYRPDWRWEDTGAACRWYPATRVIRQPAPGDWSSVVEEAARAIRARVAPGLADVQLSGGR